MRKTFLISLFSMVCGILFAQDTNISQINPAPQINTKPQFRATLRARGEHDLDQNLSRFAIMNARACLFGNLNEWLGYQVQVDLSADGQFRILDLEARFRQSKQFSFRIGQQIIPFAQLERIVPRMVALCDLPWVAQHMSGSLRDIGITANYRFNTNFPINLTGSLINGSGNNNPVWTNQLGHSFRLQFGSVNDIRFSLKTYHAENMSLASPRKNELYGADFRYFNNGFTVDAEIIRGNLTQAGVKNQRISTLLHVAKMFDLENENLKYLEPIVRWDMMGVPFTAGKTRPSNVDRLTFGLNFGFRPYNNSGFFRTGELRLNYAKYLGSNAPIYFGENRSLWADKLILEFTLEI
jgi:hypothetical protein